MVMMNEAALDGAVVSADRVATGFDDNCRTIMPKAWFLIRRRLFIAAGKEEEIYRLYVSDRDEFKGPDPAMFRFASDGQATLWYADDINFANGLAPSRTVASSDVVEKFDR